MILYGALPRAAFAVEIEYLYIDASEGAASGGHAALKLGEQVFHFQHVPPGLIRIKRDDFKHFLFQYGERENRSIRLHRMPVSEETAQLLAERFQRLLLIEDEQFDGRDGLEEDGKTLERLYRLASRVGGNEEGSNLLELKGAGLFRLDGWNEHSMPSINRKDGALKRLAERIEAAKGAGFLNETRREILRRIAALAPPDYDPRTLSLSEDRFLPAGFSYSERYADLLRDLLAVQAIAAGAPLREGVLLRPQSEEFRLSEAEIKGLESYRGHLEEQTLGLIDSSRSGRGLSLLWNLARLVALDESIRSGRLAFIALAEDAGGGETPPAEPEESPDRSRERFGHRFGEAKAVFAAQETDEWDYVHLEQSANLLWEAGNALREGRAGRYQRIHRSPLRMAKVQPILPAASAEAYQASLDRLAEFRQAYEVRLKELYLYDLLGRNCVSEIFRVIDAAMWDAASQRPGFLEQEQEQDRRQRRVEDESTRRLGGHVDGRFPAYIPFVSFEEVGRRWRVESTLDIPSHRLRRLDRIRARENRLLAELRESNVLTSSLYRWHGGDSAFLFFTDEEAWSRPLAGGFNLAVGLAQGVYGLLNLSRDGGRSLWQGAKGMLISLPELFFFNIRKGTYPGIQDFGD